jgi:prepilin peptidase CpaA
MHFDGCHVCVGFRKSNAERPSYMLNTLSLTVLPLLMLLAAATDIAVMRIPNWLTGLTALLFFPMAYLTGMPLNDIGSHALAGVVLFFAGYVLFSLRLFGGGDAKLMAAAGLWFGSQDAMRFLVMTAVAGGVLAVAYMVWTAISVMQKNNTEGAMTFRQKLRTVSPKLPYGCALAVGAILTFPITWWAEVGNQLVSKAV